MFALHLFLDVVLEIIFYDVFARSTSCYQVCENGSVSSVGKV